MADKPIIDALEDMGLDRDEAEIYNLIVSLGSATIGKISTLSDFSRSKIYGVFDKLLAKGWIKVVSDKPKKFAPIDPREILSNRKESIISAYEVALKSLSPVYESSKLTISETLTCRGSDVVKLVEDMLPKAKNEIDIITAFLPTEVMKKMATALESTKAKGTDIKIIISERLKDEPIINEMKDKFDIKVRNVPNAGVLIIDDNELLLGSIDQKDVSSITTGLLGIWTKDEQLIKFIKMIFKQLYQGESSEEKRLGS